MTIYRADLAWVDGAMLADVAIAVDGQGRIAGVSPGAVGGERIAGIVVPGVANLHAHAFQRGMAGLAERAGGGMGGGGENFWGWREVMYRFLARLEPPDVEAIAAQLYVECLLHGYTSVAEFHYLHNAPDGSAYADPAELAWAILAAARTAGIGLTLLPVLYRRGGFGGAAPTPGQRRFVLEIEAYARLCNRLSSHIRVGVAPHSLRAVTPNDLAACLAIGDGLGPDTPVHIHVAEQSGEVADCLAWSGAPPVRWLLDHAPVGPGWCLVHATHVDASELAGMAASGAVVGLCQSTEANLGDGRFPLAEYLAAGGRFGVGSDSNVSTSPVEELRWAEYARRLETRSRNGTFQPPGTPIGAALLDRATSGGAQALGGRGGRIAVGCEADLVVLDPEHPALVGRAGAALLDGWVFNGNATPVRDVMVAGHWVVRDGRHHGADRIAAGYRRAMRRLAEAT